MNYSELTLRYFHAPAGVGVLAGPGVARGIAGSHAGGTWVQFEVRVVADVIGAARFLAFACPHTIAVAAWIVENSIGRDACAAGGMALPESVRALENRFEVPVAKRGRLLIVEDAWRAAMTRAQRR